MPSAGEKFRKQLCLPDVPSVSLHVVKHRPALTAHARKHVMQHYRHPIRDVGGSRKVGRGHMYSGGTLINKNCQIFKLQRDTLPNNLQKVVGHMPPVPPFLGLFLQ